MKFNLNVFNQALRNKNFLKEIEYFEEIDSTNTYLRNSQNIDRKLVVADFQTAGRGRFNRKWISNKGENLTFSIGIEKFNIKLLTKLNFFIPIILTKSLEVTFDIRTDIKWPNDLLYNNKKFCGMLIENSIESNNLAKVILGIGLNCNQTKFPDEISHRTTSLKLILNQSINREKLLASIIDLIADNWNSFLENPNAFYQLYKIKCTSIGKEISLLHQDKIFKGLFLDVNENGELVLQTNDETLTFNSGEITTIKE